MKTDDCAWQDRISIDNNVMGGKPVIKGTRLALQYIVGALAGGDSIEDVCKAYRISEEDVRAALAYAAYALEDEIVHALPGR